VENNQPLVSECYSTTTLPLVSVIIIFLNEERFLEEAIASVFAQTYKHWELIIVDDGSTDSSTEIARRYAQQYPDKVTYLDHENHQNLGISATRNLGVRHAKGKYVTFLDGDDVFLPEKLEKQVAILESFPEVGMVYGNTLYWYSWTNKRKDKALDNIPQSGTPLDVVIHPPKLMELQLLSTGAVPCVCSFLIKRQVIEEIGGFEAEFGGLYEDQVFLAKIFLKLPVFVESGCWEKYRQHPASMCSTSSKEKEYLGRRKFLTWLAQYWSTQAVPKTHLWSALQQQLNQYNRPTMNSLTSSPTNFTQSLKEYSKSTLQSILPTTMYEKLQSLLAWPPIGWINFGTLRRLTPLSREFGYDRGLPIDRYYIHRFLTAHQNEIQGRVLEIGESTYTRQFGGDRVTHSDVLHVIEGNPEATFVGDLTTADHIPSNTFDCIILTQTLHLIYDMKAAVATLYRTLKPGGILLITVPGISQVVKCEWGDDWCWALTTQSARLLLEEFFPKSEVQVEAYGNVLAAAAFLYGAAVEDLRPHELDYHDPEYQCLITLHAVKPEAEHATSTSDALTLDG
jgi:glycosyltransferase involved in cell wall biosynthesis